MLTKILEIPAKDFDRVASGLFAYLFGRIDRQKFYEYTGDRVLAKKVLANARGSGYVLKNCKLYAHAHCVFGKTETPPKPSAYEVTRRDANFLKKLDIRTEKYSAFTIPQFDQLISQSLMTADMRTHVGKLISKKMNFLIKSYGLKRPDIESSLTAAALYALYKQYPKYKSALHAKNICKTTIHNTAMNLIQHHTRGKRQALQGPDHQAVHVPLDAMFDIAAPVQHEYKEALQSLVSLSHKMSDSVQEFLLAAAGKHHPQFSVFLGEDNGDAAERMHYDQYLGRLRSFFNVTEQQTKKLFAQLRPHLV